MNDPLFLDKVDVLQLHGDLAARFGGSPQVRDVFFLDSALADPPQTYLYHEDADIFDLAVDYYSSLAVNRPFDEGNERTGMVAAFVFLKLNGLEVNFPPAFVTMVVEGVMDHQCSEEFFAKFLFFSCREAILHQIQSRTELLTRCQDLMINPDRLNQEYSMLI